MLYLAGCSQASSFHHLPEHPEEKCFYHRLLANGLILSACSRNDWIAASPREETLQAVQPLHRCYGVVREYRGEYTYQIRQDGNCDWICLLCGVIFVTTSDELVLHAAERNHTCARG